MSIHPVSIIRRLRAIHEKLSERQIQNGWVLSPLAFVYALLVAYALRLGDNYYTWHDVSVFAHMTPAIFLLNALVIYIVFTLVHAMTNRWVFSAALVGFVSFCLVVMHINKLRVLDVPLVPADIYLVSQAMIIAPHLSKYMSGMLALLGATLVLSLLAFWWIRRFRIFSGSLRYRLIASTSSVCLLATLLTVRITHKDANTIGGVFTWIDWNQKENYQKNGFFLSTVANLTLFISPIKEPQAYSRETVEAIYQKYAAQAPAQGDAATSGTANVILILAEAFWDVDRLGVPMTRDPIPFFHQLQKTCASGRLKVPTYGGYTAQAEFEMLTGFSMAWLPETSNPYQSYINLNRKLPTLPNIFKRHNYKTFAVHPYFREFWDRAKAYPLLGFDRFYHIYDFKDKTKSGPFVSDEVLVDKIIELGGGPSPYFMFAISMATHGPYTYDAFLNEPLDVTAPLAPESHKQLKTYINAITRLDTALKRLIEHFSAEKRKTVIIVFGDHLPMLGTDMSVYREAGYLRPDDDIMDRMHDTPVVAWANFKLPSRALPGKAHQMMPFILEAAGIKPDGFPRFVDGFTRARPLSYGEASAMSGDYCTLQYDILFGKQYALGMDDNALRASGMAEAIVQGSRQAAAAPAPGKLSIAKYGPTETTVGEVFNPQPDGKSAFWIVTENASEETVVVFNGKELATTVGKDGKFITAEVAPQQLSAPDIYQLWLYDKRAKRKSNEVSFKLFPSRKPAPTPIVPPPAVNWGPQFTQAGQDFNVQADGFSALWFILERPAKDLTVLMNDKPLLTTIVGESKTISASVPKNFYMKAGDCSIQIKDNPTGKVSPPLKFKVLGQAAAPAGGAATAALAATTATAGAQP